MDPDLDTETVSLAVDRHGIRFSSSRTVPAEAPTDIRPIQQVYETSLTVHGCILPKCSISQISISCKKKIWLSFMDTATNTSREIANYFVKQSSVYVGVGLYVSESKSNIASRWALRESYLMFTSNRDKDHRKYPFLLLFSLSVNKPYYKLRRFFQRLGSSVYMWQCVQRKSTLDERAVIFNATNC